MIIKDLLKKYQGKLDYLDLELLISHILKKTREFVLAHPEHKLKQYQISSIKYAVSRRAKHEPLAYILGHKEFFGLDFRVNKDVLIPRPETELLVEEALKLKPRNKIIIDLGTGSGNIIISLAKNIHEKNKFIGIDISSKALSIAKKNAKLHRVNKQIKFIKGNLLNPLLHDSKFMIHDSNLIILANLPYLSEKIYNSAKIDVKKYEPRSALYSANHGLDHYEKLLYQLKKIKNSCFMLHASCFMEISPEQKTRLAKLAKSILPEAKPQFQKDLAGKWRVCRITL